MDIAFFADEVSKDDFDEAVRLGVEAGATGVELRGGIWRRAVHEIDDAEVKRVQKVLDRYGVRILSLGSPFGKCAHDDPEAKERHQRIFERMVELAHVFDTKIIRGFGLWNPFRKEEGSRPDVAEYMDVSVPVLEPAVRLAASEGVTLSLENEDATLVGSCAEARMVADRLGSTSGFSFCWDVNNGIACGEAAVPDGYDQIRGRISHLHVKPNPEAELDPISGSELAYADLLKMLLADGYTGAASIEHWNSPELMLKGIRQLRAVVDTL